MQDQNPYAASGLQNNLVTKANIGDRLKRVFSFRGRASRLEFWLVILGVVVVFFTVVFGSTIIWGLTDGSTNVEGPVSIVDPPNDTPPAADIETSNPLDFTFIISFLVMAVLFFFVIWAQYATVARRFHDRGKSGWMALVALIPYIGGLWIIIECGLLEGTKGPNQYGPEPIGPPFQSIGVATPSNEQPQERKNPFDQS